ncbi:MAG: UDP-N-acetylmuramate dehydrogenase [Acidimicrobiales bacterium]
MADQSASTKGVIALLEPILGDGLRLGVPMAAMTTWRVGGPAAALAEVRDHSVLAALSEAVRATGVEVLVVGRGSNLLVADEGFDGLVVHLRGEFDRIDIAAPTPLRTVGSTGPGAFAAEDRGSKNADWPGKVLVTAGGAVPLPVLARRTAARGLRGLEWAVGVPGSVGGAVVMNAGGHGSEVSSCLRAAEVFDLATGRARRWGLTKLGLSYRRSALGPTQVVTAAEFWVSPGSPARAEAVVNEVVSWRHANQPGGSNAGSVFTNPEGASAGQILDEAGLKGHRIGSAAVSGRHANFFQSDPGGSASDIAALMVHCRQVVSERLSIDLVPEVRLVGFDPEICARLGREGHRTIAEASRLSKGRDR